MSNTRMKLGKHLPKFDPRTPHLSAYLKQGIAPPPAQCMDYTQHVSKWPMMGNDTLGDCTCAAAGHMIQEWTANTKPRSVVLSDPEVEKAYRHFSPPGTDNGANMLDVLNYWRQTGFPHSSGHDKILAFVALEPRNDTQVRDSVYLFGNCYIGVALPDFAVNAPDMLTVPWTVPAKGAVGDAKPNPNNGHCIPAVAYDEHNLYVVTWGALKAMTWQFYDTYMDESYAVLSRDWINSKLKQAPPGLDLAHLQQDLSSITGEKISLSQAQEAAA